MFLADILIRYIACREFNLKNDELIFDTNEYGKPYLVRYDNFHFNITHSGHWVLCGISKGNIGIDLEKIDHDPLDVAKKYFSVLEYSRIIKNF